MPRATANSGATADGRRANDDAAPFGSGLDVGFYLGTSLRAGPFRFNLSKSGIGVSAGVPGFRVGTGPRGNYVRVSAAGVSYRATLGNARRRPAVTRAPEQWRLPPAPNIVMEDVTGVSAAALVATGADDLLDQLNRASRRVRLCPLAAVFAVAVGGALPSPFGGLAFLVALIGTIWLALRDRARRSVVVFYDVDGPQAQWFESLLSAFGEAASLKGLWRINSAGSVRTTYQFKTNSGASTLISRSSLRVSTSKPRILVTNIAVPSLSSGRQVLHFLPDRLLVRDGRQFGEVRYSQLQAIAQPQRFIEAGRMPRDAERVDTTWQYVNVKGGPDRRYKNNRQLPVLLYGRIELRSSAGLRWIVDCSRVAVATRIAEVLAKAQSPRELADGGGASVS